jgi:hypothetical protein
VHALLAHTRRRLVVRVSAGVVEAYENERRPLFKLERKRAKAQAEDSDFHHKHLLPTDRKNWSDEQGNTVALDSPQLPGYGLEWMDTEWKVITEVGSCFLSGLRMAVFSVCVQAGTTSIRSLMMRSILTEIYLCHACSGQKAVFLLITS